MNFFSRFFKPKWQHKNPQVRKQALLNMDMQDPAAKTFIAQMARADQDPVLRQFALKKLTDLNILKEIGNSDKDAIVRDQALQRFRRLIAGLEPGCDSAEREQWLTQLSEKDLEFMVRQAADAQFRRLALEHITKESIFTDVAVLDSDINNRLYAVSKIVQKSSLERVAKSLRTRDKRVCAEAERKLAEYAENEARPIRLAQRGKQLCAELESLTPTTENRGDYSKGAASLQRINDEWERVLAEWQSHNCGPWPETFTARFTAAKQAFEALIDKHQQEQEDYTAREAEYQPIRIEKQRIITSLEQLTTGLTFDIVRNEREWGLLRVAYDAALDEWQRLQLLPSSEETQWQLRFTELKQTLDLFLRQAAQLFELQLLEQRIREAAAGQELSSATLRMLEEQWEGMQRALLVDEHQSIKEQISEALNALRTRLTAQADQRKAVVKQFKNIVQELELALVDGRVNEAQTLMRQAQQALHDLSDDEVQRLRGQQWPQRLAQAQARIKELLAWKGWAAAPVKERLCQDMETLAQEVEENREQPTYDFNAAAQQIKEMKEEWIKIGTADPEIEQQLKERFHSAANRAYEICHTNFEKFAAERRLNFERKEAICSSLEQYLTTLNAAQSVDFQTVEITVKLAQKEWREIGPVDRKHQRLINERFKTLLDQIYGVVKANKESNREKKQQLISRVQTHVNELSATQDDPLAVRTHLDAIKVLQKEWKEIGRAIDDKKLWENFISVCNQGFELQRAQREARRQSRQQLVDQRQALCEKITQLAQLEGEALRQARSEVEEISAQWAQSEPLPKDIVQKFEAKFRAARAMFEQRDRARIAAVRNLQAEAIAKKAQLCEELEVLADNLIVEHINREDAAARIQVIQQAWHDIQSLDEEAEKALAQRFKNALDVVLALETWGRSSSVVERLTVEKKENLQRCEELCLKMEVLAEVPSPPEYKQARIEYQVSQLAGKMGRGEGGEVPATDLLRQLARQWYFTGPVPAESRPYLTQRFQSAWGNVKNKSSEMKV